MEEESSPLIVGKQFPRKYVQDYYLLVHHLTQFAEVEGDKVDRAVAGAYGLLEVELPNPDVDEKTRRLLLPIENKKDYLALSRMILIDRRVVAGDNEVVVLCHPSRGVLGRPKPSIYAAMYERGVWRRFYEAVDAYSAQEYRWPKPLVLYKPGDLPVFPQPSNILHV